VKTHLRHHPLAILGLVIVGVAIVLAAVGPTVAPYDPERSDPAVALEPPNWDHIFGTDATGMDVFSRTIAAPRVDLTIGLAAAAIAFMIGLPLGVMSGYFGGVFSEIIGRTADLIQSLPVFVVAMALVAASPGSKVANIIFVVALINIPVYLRLARSEVVTLRGRAFVEAARSIGNSNRTILRRHLMPNSLGAVLVQLSVNVGWAILLTAGLSFVGAGIQVPTPEWGAMIAAGAGSIITGEWWISFFPGLALGITVFGFAVVGDAAAAILDPRNR
jgi:peptide/nickel transport system permease protein